MITQKYMASGQPSLLCALDYNNMFNLKYSKKDGYIQYTKVGNYHTDIKVLQDCVLNFSFGTEEDFNPNTSTTYGNETYNITSRIYQDASCIFVKAGDIFLFDFGYWYINVIPYLSSSGHIYVDYNENNIKRYGIGDTIDRDGLLVHPAELDDLHPTWSGMTDAMLFVKKGCQVKTDSACKIEILPLLSNSYCPKLFNYFAYSNISYGINNAPETVASSISKGFLTKTSISDTSGKSGNQLAFLITTKVDCVLSGSYCYNFNSNRRCEDAQDEFWFHCSKYYLKAGYSIKFVVNNETILNNMSVYFPII